MSRPLRTVVGLVIFAITFAIGYFQNASKSALPSVTPQTTRVVIPTAAPDGWTRLEGKGVAMQLPDTFVGGSIQDYADRLSKLGDKELSPQVNSLMQEALKNPDQFRLLAINQANESQHLTNINVVKTRFSNSAIPLETILEAAKQQYPSDFTFNESAVVKINDLPVIRMVLIFKMQSTTSKQLQYIRVDDNNDAWVTNYSTSPEDFDKWLPIFEQSYQSQELIPANVT